jgi:hypothetical protein
MTLPAPIALVVQFAFALTAYALVARWYVVPALVGRPLRDALPPLIVIHLVRPVSLWLLVPGVIVEPTIPHAFAVGTAWGDLVVTALAVLAIFLVRTERRSGVAAAWVFNVAGLLDALRNCAVGMQVCAPEHMGAAVLVPAYGVPLLLVSHVLVFRVLWQSRRAAAGARANAGARDSKRSL